MQGFIHLAKQKARKKLKQCKHTTKRKPSNNRKKVCNKKSGKAHKHNTRMFAVIRELDRKQTKRSCTGTLRSNKQANCKKACS